MAELPPGQLEGGLKEGPAVTNQLSPATPGLVLLSAESTGPGPRHWETSSPFATPCLESKLHMEPTWPATSSGPGLHGITRRRAHVTMDDFCPSEIGGWKQLAGWGGERIGH